MRIAATAMDSTTPINTASASHGHDPRFSAIAVGAKGRCPSDSSFGAEPTRSTSTGATGAMLVWSLRLAVTSGAPRLWPWSACALGITVARLAGVAAPLSDFARVTGGAALAFPRSSGRGATCTGGGLAPLGAARGAAAAPNAAGGAAGLPAGGPADLADGGAGGCCGGAVGAGGRLGPGRG